MKSDKNELSNLVGNRLADLRKTLGFTQKAMAEILHVSESTLAHYEQGITLPNTDMMLQIANYFQVSIDYLVGRCESRLEYTKLNARLYQQMTLGKMVDIVDSLDTKSKKYLCETIRILNENEKNRRR